MLVNLQRMTPREMVAGLMRGDRADMKAGYRAESAALAAIGYKRLGEDEGCALIDYARGFANGIADAIESADPNARYGRYDEADSADYREGLYGGRLEDGFLLYPTLPAAS